MNSTSPVSVYKPDALRPAPPSRNAPTTASPRHHGAAKTRAEQLNLLSGGQPSEARRLAFVAGWKRVLLERPDAPEMLAEVELRLPFQHAELAAHERAGDADAFAAAILDACARLDSLRSSRLCIDCGASDVPTISPGLTSGRVCAKCLRESLS